MLKYIKYCCGDYKNQKVSSCVDYDGDEVISVKCKVCGHRWSQDLLVHIGRYEFEDEEDEDQ